MAKEITKVTHLPAQRAQLQALWASLVYQQHFFLQQQGNELHQAVNNLAENEAIRPIS